ncbi:MAG: ArsR/SmtB family transcription factor [Christensenellales bacterium]
MKVFETVDPLIEALIYLSKRANNNSFAKSASALFGLYPDIAVELEAMISPIMKLESVLDEAASNIDDERMHFFFDSLDDNIKNPHINNIANILLMPIEPNRTELCSLQNAVETAKEATQEEIILRIRVRLLVSNEKWYAAEHNDINYLLDFVSEYNSTDTNKIKILSIARRYPDYLDELHEMLLPMVTAIENSISLCKPLLNRFYEIYSGISYDDLLQILVGNDPLSAKLATLSENNNEIVVAVIPSLFNIGMCNVNVYDCMEADAEDLRGKLYMQLEVSVVADLTQKYGRGGIPLNQLASYSKALGDPARLKILSMLKGNNKVCTSELAKQMNLSFTAMSHHINKLLASDLITGEKNGNFVFYSLNVDGVRWLIDSLTELLLDE